jgi:hypothetical protein
VRQFILLFSFLSLIPSFSPAFSLLSHEAIIDATWEKSIKPLLKSKYPSSSEDDLKEAHAYVYGGSLMADIGYYPFGSLLFTNLVHYVRTGDFVSAALDEATTLDEYAFSLGLLCHYNADRYGHSLATNIALPILFPKEREKYGDTITYEVAKKEHIKTEFGFDVFQTAKGNYTPEAQFDFIGFKVSEPVLSRAFEKTYGLKLKSVFKNLPVSIETFRFTVKQLFPELTRDAWKVRQSMITKLNPLAEQSSYTKKIDKRNYKKQFGKPRPQSLLLSFIMSILPKVGPFAGLKFKEPSEKAEQIFDKSMKAIVSHYTQTLGKLREGVTPIENINYDTGKNTARYEYELADKSYYRLLRAHARNDFKYTTPEIKTSLIQFYNSRAPRPPEYKKDYKVRKTDKSLSELQHAELKKTGPGPL